MRRGGDSQSNQRVFEKVVALAEEYALGDILKHAAANNALMLAFQEPTEEAFERAKLAIDALKAQGVMLSMTGYLAGMGRLLWTSGRHAEGLAVIAEALALVERTGERVAEAELWRVKGELLLKAAASDAEPEAERCYRTAIDIARRQRAKNVGAARHHQPGALVATAGQPPGSAADAGGDLRLVLRGF